MILKNTLGMDFKLFETGSGESGNRISKRISSKKNSLKKGFTLVELIVVLVIIAILASIGVMALLGMIDKAKEKEYIAEGEAALAATEIMMSDAYTDNVTYLSKEIRSQAKETAKAPDGTSFTIWTADSFSKADGTYKSMRSYSISEAMYKTEDGYYVYFDGSEWTVFTAQSDENGNDVSEGKAIADNNTVNKIYVWPLQAGDDVIGKDTAGAINVGEEDTAHPDTEKPEEKDVDTANKDSVRPERNPGENEFINVAFIADNGAKFSSYSEETKRVYVKYNLTKQEWVDSVADTSFKGIDLVSYSCIAEPGFDSGKYEWKTGSGETISDISKGSSSSIYDYIDDVRESAEFRVSMKTQIVTIPITFSAVNEETLDVSVAGKTDSKIYAQYGLGDKKVVAYTKTEEFDIDNPDEGISLSKDILNVEAKNQKDNIKFYGDKHLDPEKPEKAEDAAGRWILNTLVQGQYYVRDGKKYTNSNNVSSWVESYVNDYVTANRISEISDPKAVALANGGLTFEACAEVYKKIYIRPWTNPKNNTTCSVTFGLDEEKNQGQTEQNQEVSEQTEDEELEQIIVDVSQIEAPDKCENSIVLNMNLKDERFVEISSVSEYSLFEDYGIEINKNDCPKVNYWYLQDCTYQGVPIGEASQFGDEDWNKWHSRKWDCSEKILENVFDEENLTGELAEIDATFFKTLLLNAEEKELQITENGWYDRTPVSAAFCELAGISYNSSTPAQKKSGIDNVGIVNSVNYITEEQKESVGYSRREKELCISTTKIATNSKFELAVDEDGNYIIDPDNIDPYYPAYTVAFSVKNNKKIDIYVFSEKDELGDKYDEIELCTKGSLKNLFRGFVNIQVPQSFINQLDTAEVDNVVNMFKRCGRDNSNFKTLDLSKIKFGNVTNSASMVEECKKLNTLILGNADFSNVTDFHQMFAGCENLNNICTSDGNNNDYEFNIQSADIIHRMFDKTKLTRINLRGDGMDSVDSCDLDPSKTYENGGPKGKCDSVFANNNNLTTVTISDIRFSVLTESNLYKKIYNYPTKIKINRVRFAD